MIIRHLCSDVSGRGKQRHPATENVKKAYVFLNPTANNGDAKGKFQKFAAPILNLAEFEVILIEVRMHVLLAYWNYISHTQDIDSVMHSGY